MLTVEEFEEEFFDWHEVHLPLRCMVHTEVYLEHKVLYKIEVWKYEIQFFQITYSRDIIGFWDNNECFPPTVVEVFPEEVTSITYVERTKDAD